MRTLRDFRKEQNLDESFQKPSKTDLTLHSGNFAIKSEADIRVLFFFELGGITKHLMTDPSGNSELCFPSILRVSGKRNSLFPLGPVIISAYYFSKDR